MFCPKCGAQNPDGSQFCAQCGATITNLTQSQTMQQVKMVSLTQPERSASQQFTYSQPPVNQQPQKFGSQPMYGQPYPQQVKAHTPLDPRKKKKIIIASVCAAMIAAFLIVLFAAIIPNSGFKGKLRHVWRQQDRYSTSIMDLKSKTISSNDEVIKINNWQVQGNHLIISAYVGMTIQTEDYICAMTPDGRTLFLFDVDGYSTGDKPDAVLERID